MFSVDDRTAVCDALLTTARADRNIAGAALVGSTADGWTDEWSDIDLALKLAPDTNFDDAVATWTTVMYASHDAVHHLDMHAGTVLYRVFLLADSLQVDLSFWPADLKRAFAATTDLLLAEVDLVEPALARRLTDPAAILTGRA